MQSKYIELKYNTKMAKFEERQGPRRLEASKYKHVCTHVKATGQCAEKIENIGWKYGTRKSFLFTSLQG